MNIDELNINEQNTGSMQKSNIQNSKLMNLRLKQGLKYLRIPSLNMMQLKVLRRRECPVFEVNGYQMSLKITDL